MRSLYQAIDAVYALLTQAQTVPSGLPFAVDPNIKIHDWQPSDFSIDGHETQDGVYIYFSKSRFDDTDADTQTQSHRPAIHIDMYASISASVSTGTGTVTSSEKRADRALRNMSIGLYEALSHAAFRRLLEETLESGAGWTPSTVHVTEAEKIGVLRVPRSSKCLAVQRLVVLIDVCENHDTVTGVDYGGTDDFLVPYRVDE